MLAGLNTVIIEKTKILISIILAIVVAFLAFGLTVVLFPGQEPTSIPRPEVSVLDQILSALSWIGLAVVCAIAIVGAILLTSKVRRKEEGPQDNFNVDSLVVGLLESPLIMNSPICTMLWRMHNSTLSSLFKVRISKC